MTGYVPRTSFWMDFTIADMFVESSIRNTYDRAFQEWKGNIEYLTELVMVLNWKCWDWHTTREPYAERYSRLYADLYERANMYCMDNLIGDDMEYYLRTVD